MSLPRYLYPLPISPQAIAKNRALSFPPLEKATNEGITCKIWATTSLFRSILTLTLRGLLHQRELWFSLGHPLQGELQVYGNFSFRYEKLVNGARGFDDYSKTTVYNIRWSHSQDSKANPNSNFSASVNLGSSEYFQQSINQLNSANFLNNNLSSSVSYSRTFPKYPRVNISLTTSLSQNKNTQTANLTLPTFQGNMGAFILSLNETG